MDVEVVNDIHESGFVS